jgi:hypothetical protein
MRFPSKLLEILLDPKQIFGASHLLHSAAAAASAAAVAASFLLSLSSLAVSADSTISLLISSITSSSCSSGWSCCCSLLSCKNFWHIGQIIMISHAFLHLFPTSPVGCALALHFHPLFQGFNLTPTDQQKNAVCSSPLLLLQPPLLQSFQLHG